MIQRIQTVYLLISVVLIGLLFALPFAEIAKDGAIYLFNFIGVSADGVTKMNGIIIPVLIFLILMLQGYAIMSFKNRPLQLKVVGYAIVVLLALIGVFFYFTYISFGGAQISYKIAMTFPLIAIILDYLAIRAIKKDEALIRSIDRIR